MSDPPQLRQPARTINRANWSDPITEREVGMSDADIARCRLAFGLGKVVYVLRGRTVCRPPSPPPLHVVTAASTDASDLPMLGFSEAPSVRGRVSDPAVDDQSHPMGVEDNSGEDVHHEEEAGYDEDNRSDYSPFLRTNGVRYRGRADTERMTIELHNDHEVRVLTAGIGRLLHEHDLNISDPIFLSYAESVLEAALRDVLYPEYVNMHPHPIDVNEDDYEEDRYSDEESYHHKIWHTFDPVNDPPLRVRYRCPSDTSCMTQELEDDVGVEPLTVRLGRLLFQHDLSISDPIFLSFAESILHQELADVLTCP